MPVQAIRRHRQGMSGIRRGLQFPLLPAAQRQFPADALDAVKPDLNTVIGEIGLQALWPASFPSPLVSRLGF